MSEEQRLVGEKVAARFISCSLSTIRRLKDSGAMPFIRLGSRGLRYDMRDLEQFIEQNRQKGRAPCGESSVIRPPIIATHKKKAPGLPPRKSPDAIRKAYL